jgi:hypothetical protein
MGGGSSKIKALEEQNILSAKQNKQLIDRMDLMQETIVTLQQDNQAQSSKLQEQNNKIQNLETDNTELKESNKTLELKTNKLAQQITSNAEEKIRIYKQYAENLSSLMLNICNPNNETVKIIDETIQFNKVRCEALQNQFDEAQDTYKKKINEANKIKTEMLKERLNEAQNNFDSLVLIKNSNNKDKKETIKLIVIELKYYSKELNHLQSSLNPDYERQDKISIDPKICKILADCNINNDINAPNL